jgi:hypothetical protein
MEGGGSFPNSTAPFDALKNTDSAEVANPALVGIKK